MLIIIRINCNGLEDGDFGCKASLTSTDSINLKQPEEKTGLETESNDSIVFTLNPLSL